jgi:hypothetical protein
LLGCVATILADFAGAIPPLLSQPAKISAQTRAQSLAERRKILAFDTVPSV